MLGSTYPDTVAIIADGSVTYAYKWDGQWLSLNGNPAYVSDIYPYSVEDAQGNFKEYTRILMPAVRNLETDKEEFFIISYSFDEDFNYTLESIIPEPEKDSNGNMIVPKDRVKLVLGDKVQLLYEGFNEVTDEEFFVVDDGAIINITTGNSDLNLEYADLVDGRYQLAFLLEDHSQNDTLIFDERVFIVQTTGTNDIDKNSKFEFYPNPTKDGISLVFNEFDGTSFDLNIYNVYSQQVLTKVLTDKKSNVEFSLPNGVYFLEIVSKDKRIIEKMIISK